MSYQLQITGLGFINSLEGNVAYISQKIGIGTTAPFSSLQVVGTGQVVTIGEASNTAGKQLLFGVNVTDGHGEIQSVWQGTGYTALALQPNGGFTGIGTIYPSKTLDVAGTGKFSGQLTLGSTITNGTFTYTLPGATGTLALTTDIPSLTANAPLSYVGGVLSISQANTSTNGYLSSTDWNTFNNKQIAGDYITALTGEATATGPGSAAITLSNSAVIGKVLTGLSITGGTIGSTDSILTAFGKVQNQINSLVGGVNYQGTWNASTNTPALASSVGTKGYYYVVSVAGSTNLNGITDWKIGDWAIYDGTAWQKVDNTDTLTSVGITSTAAALSISNSPLTANGNIGVNFAGTSAQYVAGDGTLASFPSLTGYVPYTGATSDVDLGTHVLNAQSLHVKGTAGAGHLGLKHQTANPTGSANESLLFADINGNLGWQNNNLYLSTFVSNANTANRTYTFPDASGTIALTSDIPSLTGYITGTGTSGYVPYFNGTSSVTGTSNLFWDNTNKFLGIGTNAPSAGVTSYSTTAATQFKAAGTAPAFTFSNTLLSPNYGCVFGLATANGHFVTGTAPGDMAIANQSTTAGAIVFGTGTTEKMRMTSAGTFSIGNTNSTYTLDVSGTGRFTGALTGASATFSSSVTASTLTANGGYSYLYGLRISGNDTGNTIYSGNANIGITADSGNRIFIGQVGSSTVGLNVSTTNGNVLIGKTAADVDAPLEVQTKSGNGTTIVCNSTTADNPTIYLRQAGTSTFGAIQSNTDLVLKAGNAERMRITSGGDVGIGTTTASGRLTINNPASDGSTPVISIRDTSNVYEVGYLNFNQSTDMMTLMNKQGYSASGIAFGTNNTERMRISQAGNVGIGTSSPSRLLNISGNGTDGTQLQINGTQDSAGIKLIPLSGDNWEIQANTSNQFFVYNRTDSAYRFLIDGTGNVGIGTSSPANLLDVVKSGTNAIRVQNTLNTSDAYLIAQNTGGSAFFGINATGPYIYTASALDFTLLTNNAERMRISSTGNVGIGTSTPTETLTLAGSARITGQAANFATGTRGVNIDVISSSGNGRIYMVDGTGTAGDLLFGTANTERMRITSGGYTKASPNGTYLGVSSNYHEFVQNSATLGNLYVYSNSGSYTGTNINSIVDRAATSAFYHIYTQSGGIQQFYVRGDGVIFAQNTTVQAISDVRTKENIVNSKDGLNIINALRPVRFDFKEGFGNDRKNQLGFIAQEVEAIFPEAVDVWGESEEEGNPYKSIGTTSLIPVLVKAIQEQQQQIEELKAKIK